MLYTHDTSCHFAISPSFQRRTSKKYPVKNRPFCQPRSLVGWRRIVIYRAARWKNLSVRPVCAIWVFQPLLSFNEGMGSVGLVRYYRGGWFSCFQILVLMVERFLVGRVPGRTLPDFLFSCWALTTMETHQMKPTWAAKMSIWTQISGILQKSCRIVQFQYAQKPMDFWKIKCLVKNPWECCEMSGAKWGHWVFWEIFKHLVWFLAFGSWAMVVLSPGQQYLLPSKK